MSYFISQISMGVMWHSGRLSGAFYDLFYFTDLHGCDVALRATSVGPSMTYFISQIYMGVMWHSGRLECGLL